MRAPLITLGHMCERDCEVAILFELVGSASALFALEDERRQLGANLKRYTTDVGIRCYALLGILLGTATLDAAAGHFAIGGGVGAYYGMPLGRSIYDPWFSCTPPYCRDAVHFRLELERHRRMQELRERATPPEPRIYAPADGTWVLHRYIPPATSEANIQPAYRSASQLRPEYEQSGQLRPEYKQSARPSGEPATESLK